VEAGDAGYWIGIGGMHTNDIASGVLQSPREAKMVGVNMGEQKR
jgi:hypothetical protein